MSSSSDQFEYTSSYCPVYFRQPTSTQLHHFYHHYYKLVNKYINDIKRWIIPSTLDHNSIADLNFGITIGELALLMIGNYTPPSLPSITGTFGKRKKMTTTITTPDKKVKKEEQG